MACWRQCARRADFAFQLVWALRLRRRRRRSTRADAFAPRRVDPPIHRVEGLEAGLSASRGGFGRNAEALEAPTERASARLKWTVTLRSSPIGDRSEAGDPRAPSVKSFCASADRSKDRYRLLHQNKPSGLCLRQLLLRKAGRAQFLEFCENGAKATAWEITSKRCGPDFFAAHTLTELESWSDHALEEVGRLTEPMRYDPESDKYRPVAWEDAFAEIGKSLRRLRSEIGGLLHLRPRVA